MLILSEVIVIRFSETIKTHPHSEGQLFIGVPTLHRYEHLRKCLRGILASAPTDAELVVIDNGGTFQNDISPRIQIVRPPCNLGAPASWNLIADLADGREFLIFNDDVVPSPTTITAMRNAPGWMVCALAFGAFLTRPLLWETVGRFDEFLWPMYWEDTDYQARMLLTLIEDASDSAGLPPRPHSTVSEGYRFANGVNNLYRYAGGIIGVASGRIEHLEGGSQTKKAWMEAWIDRTRDRWHRKWNHGNNRSGITLGDINISRLPFDGQIDDPLDVYWSECHQHGWEPYLDKISELAEACESALQLGLHVGRFTLPFLRSQSVKEVHCYDWDRPEEWDFIMRLDELHGRKLQLHSSYDPRRSIPCVDFLFIDEFYACNIAKRSILKQVDRVRKYVAFLGPDSSSCPACEWFKSRAREWKVVHFNNGLTIFGRT